MRVLHVLPSMSASWGGPVSVLVGLIDSLASRGVENEVFSTDLGLESDIVETAAVGTQIVRTGKLSRFWTGHSSSTDRELSAAVERCDVVHIHELWHHPHYVAHRVARKLGRPYLISPHGELDPWALKHKRWKKTAYMTLIQKRSLRRASAVHALTSKEASQILRIAPDVPVRVIANGVDEAEFYPLPQRGESYPSLVNNKVVLFLGRLHEKKGLDVLVAAIAKLRTTHPDLRLIIAGDSIDDYREQVREFVDKVAIGDITTFTGHLEGQARLGAMATADVFVLPSRSEGFPMAALESLAAGIPTVLTPECYFPEIVEAGAGLQVVGTPTAFAEAISRVVSDESMSAKMSENGRSLIASRFTWGQIGARMHDLYEEIFSSQ